MASGLRVRVTWDDTVVEDRVYLKHEVAFIGAGADATTIAPGAEGKYVVVAACDGGWELTVPTGAADAVELPDEPIATLPFKRKLELPVRSARLTIGGALVELEVLALEPRRGDGALVAWAAAAVMLSLLIGGGYKLTRLFGDGDRPQWGRQSQLSEHEASRARVRVGPDGIGAARPQAGTGLALHGKSTAPKKTPSAPKGEAKAAAPSVPKVAHQARRPGPRADAVNGASKNPLDDGVAPKAGVPTPDKVVSRTQLIEDGQSALLAADLRKSIDSFSRAQKEGPLDYDQMNWLGLAHYLTGEYDEAERVWTETRQRDSARADAVNNLASVAKRRGDTAHEIELLDAALQLAPADCHASNSLALAQAKRGDRATALATLTRSDAACGGNYAYTSIQRAAIEALGGNRDDALRELESGLQRVDTLIPIKEFEVYTDLQLDPAFASLRTDARFRPLLARYLPRASSNPAPSPKPAPQVDPYN
jgi:tetratricopeptide (TPR) repeat protein